MLHCVVVSMETLQLKIKQKYLLFITWNRKKNLGWGGDPRVQHKKRVVLVFFN